MITVLMYCLFCGFLGMALPKWYRWLVYLCYCRFPRNRHFKCLQSYKRKYDKEFILFLIVLYALWVLCFYVLADNVQCGLMSCLSWGLDMSLWEYLIHSYQGFTFPLEKIVWMLWLGVLGAYLILISGVDFKLHLIPLRLLAGMFLWVMLYHVLIIYLTPPQGLLNTFVLQNTFQDGVLSIQWWGQKVLVSLALWIGYRCTKIGMADILFLWILVFLFDAYFWLWMVLIACLLGIGYAILLKQYRGFPFGPWIAISAWLMVLIR